VGHKALARPLSDVAAMGGVPVAAVAAMMMPRTMTQAHARAIYRGMERLRVPVVGGDVTTHAGKLAISVSVVGEMRGVKPVRRSGARPGDLLVATGHRFGGSLKSGHHLRFTPRLAEGRLLATKYRAHAMIDVSDGLVRDLAHLCDAGGVGAMLFADLIPCRDLRSALYDGEDYELLAAVAPADAPVPIAHCIGMFVRGSGVWMGAQRLPVRGYEHKLK
jgi:thiamine-monophosphate kinase